METNKPIYGDRDGKIPYTPSEISEERQRGYAWQGSFGIPQAIAFYETVRAGGREKFLAGQTKQDGARHPSPNEIAGLAQQDAQGRLAGRRLDRHAQVYREYAGAVRLRAWKMTRVTRAASCGSIKN